MAALRQRAAARPFRTHVPRDRPALHTRHVARERFADGSRPDPAVRGLGARQGICSPSTPASRSWWGDEYGAAWPARHRGARPYRPGTPPTTTSPRWTTPSRPNRARARFASTTRILQILTIHEAIPGHYTQLIYANRATSRVKALFGNGAMVEGWAVYAERMMVESGYGDSPEMRLMVGKWHLRSVTNTVLDYSVHVLGMKQPRRWTCCNARPSRPSRRRAKVAPRAARPIRLTSYFSGCARLIALREQFAGAARLCTQGLPRAVPQLRQRAGAADCR